MQSLIKWAAITAVGLFCATQGAQAQPRMKVSAATINDTNQEWFRLFSAAVEKRAPGKLKLEFYPAGQLGSIPTTVEGVALGTIEAVGVASGFYIGLEPRFAVFDVPGLFDGIKHGARVFDDPAIRERMKGFGKAKGIETLAIFAQAPLMLLSHKPINRVADFSGQKLRVPGGAPLHIEPFKKIGASPLSMPLGEVLPAMQNKTIDGFVAGTTVFTTFKFYDVAKALTYVPSSMLVLPIIANTRFIDSLGPELAAIVREEALKAERASIEWTVEDIDKALGIWKTNGGQTITMAPDEQKKYLDDALSVLPPIIGKDKTLQEDYAAFLAASTKHR